MNFSPVRGFFKASLLCGALYFALAIGSWAGPISERILFVAAPAGLPKLYIIRPDGKDMERLTRGMGLEREPSVSLPMRSVAYRNTRDNNDEIYRCNLKGEESVRLTHHPAVDRQPSWSPDGKSIVFSTQRWGEDELAIMDSLDGDKKPLFRLTTDRSQACSPAWSPNGDWIAFTSYHQGQADIYLIRPDGSERRRLTQDRRPDVMPAWSPDGKKLVYQSLRGPRDKPVLIIHDLVSATEQVLELPEYANFPSWSPDGESILFVASGTRYYPKPAQMQIYHLSDGAISKFELPRTGPNQLSLPAQESQWTFFPYPW